jgi:hypothetical protein
MDRTNKADESPVAKQNLIGLELFQIAFQTFIHIFEVCGTASH